MNLLIVDDEYYSVESIQRKLEANRPEIGQIFCAYNLSQALAYFSQNEIDVMICDIEMPGGSGLELLNTIRSRSLDTICIFLTAYARFEYISDAMKLSSSDYLLKPVEDAQLYAALSKAEAQLSKRKRDQLNTLYASYWRESELTLMEQFWLDLFTHAISSGQEDILLELKYRKLDPGQASDSFFLLIIQTDFTGLSSENRSLYEFALKNIAREYFYGRQELPVVVRILEQFFALPLPCSGRAHESLTALCSQALEDFVPHFPVPFNFFLSGEALSMHRLARRCEEMLQAAHRNVAHENHVFDLSRADIPEAGILRPTLPTERWSEFLKTGDTDALSAEVSAWLSRLRHSEQATRESLIAFYYDFLRILQGSIEKEQEEDFQPLHDQLARQSADQACSSFRTLKELLTDTLAVYAQCLAKARVQDNAVSTVKSYIKSHLCEELNRDSLASMVYLNPDYLSHLFKRETGFSLTNYIIETRILESRRLLAKNDMSIQDIAIACGFQNISYFSRQFRKATGMTPREFRKRGPSEQNI